MEIAVKPHYVLLLNYGKIFHLVFENLNLFFGRPECYMDQRGLQSKQKFLETVPGKDKFPEPLNESQNCFQVYEQMISIFREENYALQEFLLCVVKSSNLLEC